MDEYIERGTGVSIFRAKANMAVLMDAAPYFEKAAQILEKLPAADVAPVVRCKDCKHFKNYGKTSLLIDGKNIKAGWCHRRAQYDEEYRMPPDGFCSYGERKDSDNAT